MNIQAGKKVADIYSLLIVDDEKIERNGIKFLLKQTGIELEVYKVSVDDSKGGK